MAPSGSPQPHSTSADNGYWPSAIARITSWDALRVVLGTVLLAAAALKGYELAARPTPEMGLLTSRWFLLGLVALELALGLLLASGLFPRPAWSASLAFFATASVVSLSKALAGESSCGCFGSMAVNPWITWVFNLAAVLVLVSCQPTTQRVRDTRFAVVSAAAAACFGLALFVYWPGRLNADGVVVGSGRSVLLDPEEWAGREFPLLGHIDIGNRLAEGTWIVVLYRHDCPRCEGVLTDYEALAAARGGRPESPRIALIDAGSADGSVRRPDLLSETLRRCGVLGRLDDSHRWLVETPLALRIDNGTVVARLDEVSPGVVRIGTPRPGISGRPASEQRRSP